MERLDGSVATAVPLQAEKKKGVLGALLSPLLRATKGAAAEMHTQSEFTRKMNQAGDLARFPAPAELLDAAEAWALSFLVADRIDDDLLVLRRSWEDATIEPVV
ncbi:MAG: hypothetical protein ACKVIQ_19820 [Acidimicrobiales bacterium]|jgi:hypothetical protein